MKSKLKPVKLSAKRAVAVPSHPVVPLKDRKLNFGNKWDFAPAPDTDFAAVRQARLDALGDLVAGHLDLAALSGLIENGPPKSLPGLVASLDHDR